ncbi:MAG TPA: prolyl oligopeptidase family serine peptidase [Candidatus Polarisedimenticolia bacterium]|nr:prolyl oligopeptidase family serine peptidase [Candidatus Polarisedimenticolia bacterium]
MIRSVPVARRRAPFGILALLFLPPLASPGIAFELPEVRAIYQQPLIDGIRPSGGKISPDDRWVAYFWNEEGLPRPLNLYVVSTHGGEPRKLSSFTSPIPESTKPLSWPRSGAGANLEFSPDSRKILYSYEGDLYVADVEGGRNERLTRTRAGESEPIWAPDGKSILYASGGSLYRLNYPGPGLLQLTAASGDAAHETPRWSPDGTRVAFVSEEGKDQHAFQVPYYIDEWVSTKDSKRGYSKSRVGVVSAEGSAVRWIDPGEDGIWWLNELVWSRDGKSLLVDYLSKDTRTRTIVAADVPLIAAGTTVPEDRSALPSPPEKKEEAPIKAWRVYQESDPKWAYTYDGFVTDTTSTDFSRDGERILFTSEKTGFNQVYAVGRTGGKPKRVTRGEAGAVDWAGWTGDGRSILTLGYDTDASRRALYLTPGAGGKPEAMALSSTYLTHPFLSKSGKLVLVEGSVLGTPYNYFVADLDSKSAVQVTRTAPAGFPEAALPVSLPEGRVKRAGWQIPERVSFKAQDGTMLYGFLYGTPETADASATEKRPVVIFVHGAGIQQNVVQGWTIYSPNFKFATVLVNRGFVVFEVDYRGSSGYGRAFRTDVSGYLGGKDLDDILSGVDFLKTLPQVDTRRIGIYGGSYGGFMAEIALFRHPGLFAAGAALRPVADWANYYRSNIFYCTQRLGTLEDNPEAYRRSSPINFAEGLQDPILLLHGVLDSNVPFQDTVQLTDRLQRYGKSFELMIYPREDHTFTEPENWIDQYSRILDFFVRHLKP